MVTYKCFVCKAVSGSSSLSLAPISLQDNPRFLCLVLQSLVFRAPPPLLARLLLLPLGSQLPYSQTKTHDHPALCCSVPLCFYMVFHLPKLDLLVHS